MSPLGVFCLALGMWCLGALLGYILVRYCQRDDY